MSCGAVCIAVARKFSIFDVCLPNMLPTMLWLAVFMNVISLVDTSVFCIKFDEVIIHT
jgi:hypothetical protein